MYVCHDDEKIKKNRYITIKNIHTYSYLKKNWDTFPWEKYIVSERNEHGLKI